MILSFGLGFSFDRPVRSNDFPCIINDSVESFQGLPNLFVHENPYQYIPSHCKRAGPVYFLVMLPLFVRPVFFPHFLFYGKSVSGGEGHQKDLGIKILFDGSGCLTCEFLHFYPALQQLIPLLLIPAVVVQLVEILIRVLLHVSQ